MVCGEIGEKPLVGCEEVALAEVVVLPATSNGFAAGWLVEEDFCDVSDVRASMSDDAAPRAGNMIKLQQGRLAADAYSRNLISKRRASEGNARFIRVSLTRTSWFPRANAAAPAEFSASVAPLLPAC
jgi:hypothetical protein